MGENRFGWEGWRGGEMLRMAGDGGDVVACVFVQHIVGITAVAEGTRLSLADRSSLTVAEDIRTVRVAILNTRKGEEPTLRLVASSA